MTRDDHHAIQNAKGWSSTIIALVAALECDYARLEELRDERGDILRRIEEAQREEIQHDERAAQFDLAEWDKENGEELRELVESATVDGDELPNGDAARERITESPLSVQVRSGWVTPGEPMEAEDFEILLSTGGPALRIMGELDEYKQPRRAWLEYQDWGAPWTEYRGEGAPAQSDLVTFCQQFFFGE